MAKLIERIAFGYIPYTFCKIFNRRPKKFQYYEYIVHHGYARHLFTFRDEYKSENVKIETDANCGLRYVLMDNKRLYFKRDLSDQKIKGLFTILTMEQDPRSPHRYLDDINEIEDKILLDIGCAEGILSLSTIEHVKHVFLFECDEMWIEALQQTFKPWEDKVTIVRKYVSNKNDENNTTLDSFFANKPHLNLFMKMDIEGMERYALQGSKKLFQEKGNISFAVCGYHRKDDEKVLTSFFNKFKCTYHIQRGFFVHKLKSVVIKGHN